MCYSNTTGNYRFLFSQKENGYILNLAETGTYKAWKGIQWQELPSALEAWKEFISQWKILSEEVRARCEIG